MRPIPFSARVRVSDSVLFRELDGESVLLSLDRETYFGLDEVGTRTWQLLTTQPSIEAAFETLRAEYDVDSEQLRRDLEDLLDQLTTHGLIEIAAPPPA
jgi:hypothetical protein